MQHPTSIPRDLLILHYHLRPGGVRRVIEMYLPALAASGAFDTITLATGDSPDPVWKDQLTLSVKGVRFNIRTEPVLGYLCATAGDTARARQDIHHFLRQHAGPETLVWAHNLGLGRNILLADELARLSAETGIPILSHHHDFWFDNRWARWPILQANGFGSLKKVAKGIFASGARVVHGTINSADQSLLALHLPGHAAWLPNPVSRGEMVSPRDVRRAKSWLRHELGHHGPIWIFPTRFLRRKNIGEAVLLTRWLGPEAIFVSTAGVSSPEEFDYAQRLETEAKRGRWAVRFQILAGRDGRAPSVPALMCASENILLTSLQEGFGLPFLEVAALGLPLLARRLGNVEPDLLRMGFRFPGIYEDVLIPSEMFDRASELDRQEIIYKSWKQSLPSACRKMAGVPPILESNAVAPIPFSRLTLEAQLEILSIPPSESWKAASPHNSAIADTVRQSFSPVAWPENAENLISPAACAGRLLDAVRTMPETPVKENDALRVQNSFIAERLKPEFLYPLLMQT